MTTTNERQSCACFVCLLQQEPVCSVMQLYNVCVLLCNCKVQNEKTGLKLKSPQSYGQGIPTFNQFISPGPEKIIAF